MKYLDKLLKILKTDRNTFFTYILTLLTAYFVVDRLVELLFIIFTGSSLSYWGPITYTIALACPVFAFFLSFPSKFCKSNQHKVSFFYSCCIALYIIGISMVVQYINLLSWMFIFKLPNYEVIISDFADLIKPAFSAIALYLPLTTFYKLFLWLYKRLNDPIHPNNYRDSLGDYGGVDLSGSNGTTGAYSFEIEFCKSKSNGKSVKLIEQRRFHPMLVVGPSGTGKSSLVMEPMAARDLEKKYFFREVSKEKGYTALSTGIATLNCPYDNDYINENFNLAMLTPSEGKESIYKAYMNKLIYATDSNGNFIYKDVGVTFVTPDNESTQRLIKVAENFNLPYTFIDPIDPNSKGLNPFTIQNPALCGLIISLVIESLYNPKSYSAEMVYMKDVAQQAIQNLVILLKIMYPKMHEGLMPNLEDLLTCFVDFTFVEKMCEELIKDEELAQEYKLQINYFKQYFYKGSDGEKDMHRYLQLASSQLDLLLRAGSIRNIVCNRYDNVDLSKVLNSGEVIFFCSRPFEVGGAAHLGFGRFFLSLMMCSVELTRGAKITRLPHFLYVDDFQTYATPFFGDMITIYRKFNVGLIVSMPNLTDTNVGGINSPFMQTLLSNASTKISFGNCTPEEYDWWEQEFGKWREWNVSNVYDKEKNNSEYSSNLGSVAWEWKDNMKKGKMQGLGFKTIIYKTKDRKGKNVVGFGLTDFLETKYLEKKKSKDYNFAKFNHSATSSSSKEKENNSKSKFNPKDVDFDTIDDRFDNDPIRTDTTDSSYLFDNEDAIIFNYKKKKE